MKTTTEMTLGETFLSKPAVKKRLMDTKLLRKDDSVHVEKWEAEDAGTPIYWQVALTPVGEVLVAASAKGVCFLGFGNGNRPDVLADLRMRFPGSVLKEKNTWWHDEAFSRINDPRQELPVRLHLKGTDFQLGIWAKLLRVPFGSLVTYSELGNGAKNARATGTAVGVNPVSIIVPCHRAVRADGSYDGYYWGPELKRQLLAYEAGLSPEAC